MSILQQEAADLPTWTGKSSERYPLLIIDLLSMSRLLYDVTLLAQRIKYACSSHE